MEDYEGIPLRDSPVWRDITPIYDSQSFGVVAIQYSLEHGEALAYFRALIAKQEFSQRALDLTSQLIEFNSADYTAWKYRWQCLQALDVDPEWEYKFTESIMFDNAKNYQLWNHRRLCLQSLGPGYVERELEFAKAALDIDDKNYHSWAHRQAVLSFSPQLWERELLFVSAILERDTRNNSAWNQRFVAVKHLATPGSLAQLLSTEIAFVDQHIQKAPRNESTWNYLWGLFTLPGCRRNEMAYHREVYDICAKALRFCGNCSPALDVLSEYYRCMGICLLEKPGRHSDAASCFEHSLSTLQLLMTADPIRKLYWQQRQAEVSCLMRAVGS